MAVRADRDEVLEDIRASITLLIADVAALKGLKDDVQLLTEAVWRGGSAGPSLTQQVRDLHNKMENKTAVLETKMDANTSSLHGQIEATRQALDSKVCEVKAGSDENRRLLEAHQNDHKQLGTTRWDRFVTAAYQLAVFLAGGVIVWGIGRMQLFGGN